MGTDFLQEYEDKKKYEKHLTGDEFNSAAFYEKIEILRLDTLSDLKAYYPHSTVEVRIEQKHRDYDEQKKLKEKGASQSTISLHNFGAAADFAIFIDGKRYGSKKNDEENSRDITPYKILGGNARKMGFFWGWDFDSGHVAQTRFVDEFLKQNPALTFKNPAVKDWYQENVKKTLEGYRPAMEYLDEIYGKDAAGRIYTGKPRTIDKLEDPLEVNKDVKQVFEWLMPSKDDF